MVKLNFISDFSDKKIEQEISTFKDLLCKLYGDFKSNNIPYNDYKCDKECSEMDSSCPYILVIEFSKKKLEFQQET